MYETPRGYQSALSLLALCLICNVGVPRSLALCLICNVGVPRSLALCLICNVGVPRSLARYCIFDNDASCRFHIGGGGGKQFNVLSSPQASTYFSLTPGVLLFETVPSVHARL